MSDSLIKSLWGGENHNVLTISCGKYTTISFLCRVLLCVSEMFLATHLNKNNKILRDSFIFLLVDFILGVFS